mmetsp:Transcript_11837/g.29798  ORF Transcript_11837/g.29798 Transcript_11837/m.29798 type:complete len:180 (+) Transcript_11837:101-640(+)
MDIEDAAECPGPPSDAEQVTEPAKLEPKKLEEFEESEELPARAACGAKTGAPTPATGTTTDLLQAARCLRNGTALANATAHAAAAAAATTPAAVPVRKPATVSPESVSSTDTSPARGNCCQPRKPPTLPTALTLSPTTKLVPKQRNATLQRARAQQQTMEEERAGLAHVGASFIWCVCT